MMRGTEDSKPLGLGGFAFLQVSRVPTKHKRIYTDYYGVLPAGQKKCTKCKQALVISDTIASCMIMPDSGVDMHVCPSNKTDWWDYMHVTCALEDYVVALYEGRPSERPEFLEAIRDIVDFMDDISNYNVVTITEKCPYACPGGNTCKCGDHPNHDVMFLQKEPSS